ncbi:rod shape-determining protein RodA [Vibrio crassostreae]|uniref:rod shape-determining protein RodA n=1 Tax=Vibrio crassostreae TaxID=246167 RepID=UPI001B311455|nr:rod shape-determining protein RodA [Vibrio crassostreae]
MIKKISPRFIDLSIHDGWKIDSWIFTSVLLIMSFSVIAVFSATNENSLMVGSHVLRNMIAVGAFVVVSRVRTTYFLQLSFKFYVAVLLMLVAVSVCGELRMGAQRWLNLGLFSFQPSELAKLSVPMVCALIVYKYGLFNNMRNVALAISAIALPSLLILKQPDLGTALMVCGSGVAVMLFAGLSWRLIFGALGAVMAIFPFIWNYVLKPYQQKRILTVLNPESDPLGAGYHVIQSKAAIGSGGIHGSGWLNGTQTHLGFIPEQHTDFIFSVIGEEFGFIGVVVLFSLYFMLMARLLYLVIKLDDIYGKAIIGGVLSILFAYVFVNVGMVTGILPVVGVPLPLISYGGTATISLMLSLGIVSAYSTQKMTR